MFSKLPLHILIGLLGGLLNAALSFTGIVAVLMLPICAFPYMLAALGLKPRESWIAVSISVGLHLLLLTTKLDFLSALLNALLFFCIMGLPIFICRMICLHLIPEAQKYLVNGKKNSSMTDRNASILSTKLFLVFTLVMLFISCGVGALIARAMPAIQPILTTTLAQQNIPLPPETIMYLAPISVVMAGLFIQLTSLCLSFNLLPRIQGQTPIVFSLNHLNIPVKILWLCFVPLPFLALPGSLMFTTTCLILCCITCLPALFHGLHTINLGLIKSGENHTAPVLYVLMGILFLIPWVIICIVLIGLSEPVFGLRKKILRKKASNKK